MREQVSAPAPSPAAPGKERGCPVQLGPSMSSFCSIQMFWCLCTGWGEPPWDRLTPTSLGLRTSFPLGRTGHVSLSLSSPRTDKEDAAGSCQKRTRALLPRSSIQHLHKSLNKVWFAFELVLLPSSLLELLPSVAEGWPIPTTETTGKGNTAPCYYRSGGFPELQKTTGYYRHTTTLFTAGSKRTAAATRWSMTTNSLPLFWHNPDVCGWGH